MRARIARLAAVLAVAAGPAAADTVEVRAHAGVATAAFDEPGLAKAEGQAVVLVAEGTHVFSAVAVSLRVPLVLASVAQPAGSYVDAAALGNPQLRGVVPLDRRVSLGLDVGIPVAGHAADLMPDRALAIAHALEGLAEPELFTQVASATPFAHAELGGDRWSAGAELRIPLAVDQDNAVGAGLIASVEGRRRLSRRLGVALASTFAVELAPVARVQDLARGTLHVRLRGRSLLAIDLQAALDGSCVGGGVRAIVRLP